MVSRRAVIVAAVSAVSAVRAIFGQTGAASIVRGKLIQTGQQSFLKTAEGRTIRVAGDEPTNKILHDGRLSGRVIEAKGHATGAESFAIDPIETRPMLVVDGTKLSRVTYYCDVCSIRTYSPGPCMCCQAETRLDLIDPAAQE